MSTREGEMGVRRADCTRGPLCYDFADVTGGGNGVGEAGTGISYCSLDLCACICNYINKNFNTTHRYKVLLHYYET